MATKKSSSFVNLIFLTFAFYSHQNIAHARKRMTLHVVGFHSLCRNFPETDTQTYPIVEDRLISYTFHTKSNFEYISYDVCNSTEALTERFVDMMLSYQFTMKQKKTGKARSLTVSLIMAHLNLQIQTRLLCELLSTTNIPVILLNRRFRAPRYVSRLSLFQHKGFYVTSTYEVRDKDSQSITQLLDLMRIFDWKHIAVVFLSSSSKYHQTYRTLTKRFIDKLINKKYCFVHYKVNADSASQLSKGIATLRKDQALKVVFLFGPPKEETAFLRRYTNQMKSEDTSPQKQWIVHDLEHPNSTQIISTMENSRRFKAYEFRDTLTTLNASTGFVINDIKKRKLRDVYKVIVYMLKKFARLETAQWRNGKRRDQISMILNSYFNSKLIYRDANNVPNHTGISTPKSKARLKSAFRHFNSTECPKSVCIAGREARYKSFENKSTEYTKEYGIACKQCAPDMFKRRPGNHHCRPCPLYHTNSEKHRTCVDTHTKHYLTVYTAPGFKSIICSCLTGLYTLFYVVVFVKYRDTPTVKSCDRVLTGIQLLAILGVQITFPLLFLGEPTQGTCAVRPISISTLNAIIVSTMVIRTQRCLNAFANKIRITKSEVRNSKLAQFFFVLLMLAINIAIYFVAVWKEKPKVLSHRKPDLLQKEIMCNTNTHFHLGLAYTIILYLICVKQAYHGRKVPSVFFEATTMCYICFIAFLSLGLLFPIEYFQKTSLQKITVRWIGISLHHLILVSLLYGKKVHVIIFKKGRNTNEHFRCKIFENIEMKSFEV